MKVYIPSQQPKPSTYYTRAGDVLPIRPYLEGIDFQLHNMRDPETSWMDFAPFIDANNVRVSLFYVKDFHVLEATELSSLELAVWGIE